MFKHLYIHIPFCNSICTFCDFVRFEKCGEKVKEKYVEYLLSEIKKIPKGKLDSIYLGGGTPNSLPLKMMEKLLESLQRLINKDTEFTIELNPELLTQAQCDLFIKYQINRISLGAQIMNDKVLKIYHRAHDTKKIKSAVNLLEKNNFQNISLDFIYGFNEMGEKDLKKEINYITNCKAIKHVSFYSLEVKENSIIAKQNYELNEQKVEDEFAFIIDELKKNK
jgi:oxygen-independent coproporphyrinogen-3 oxidase